MGHMEIEPFLERNLMVQKKLYFGALQITINSPQEVKWREQEKRFFVPIMQLQKEVEIDVSFVNDLPEFTGRLVRETESMEVYTDQKGEERYYRPTYTGDQRFAVYSKYDGKKVQVQYMESRGLWDNPNFYFLTYIHLEQLLLETETLVLHSCYTEYRGEAILFTAPSGTGKTTQAELWKKNYGSTIVNGDKCILQKGSHGFYAGGFFLHGSAPECENRCMPIQAVVIVRQSKRDYIEEINPAQKVALLYPEITVNGWNSEGVIKTIGLLEELIQTTKVFLLHCTMEDSAARVLHEYLYGEK